MTRPPTRRTLPGHLAERTRRLNEIPVRDDRDVVVYWMRAAMRGHENPALDVAITVAGALGKRLLVYQGVSERYPFASDRHHTFILEGTGDVARELAERGIGYALHVERPGHRPPALKELTERSVVVVTEDLPVPPLDGWTRRLARDDTPVWAVDTACVVPMNVVGRGHSRAFAFRQAVAAQWPQRLEAGWRDAIWSGAATHPDLPFDPVDVASMDVAELVARCDIDHAVGAVPGTRGGSRAGYARWDDYKTHGVKAYARNRNDPLRPRSVSRMSPYLHYGMVSPLRVAREAAAIGGPGADKYLDELLVWRELAYAFCRFETDIERTSVLPDWAQETLRRHDEDPRPRLDAESLERARTGDALWDAAQRSLLVRGELHNNVRMTWGKAFLGWSRGAEEALARTIDLNHRYALDGRDPASYGGILWCFGAFDRPFQPERPVHGVLRGRATGDHARRLDVDRYAASIELTREERLRVAVVGAGLAGLTCAGALADHGHDVTVFDKSRGSGGRMSTRRIDGAWFNHGAQSFTARDPRFRRRVDAWVDAGHVVPVTEPIVTIRDGAVIPAPCDEVRYVGRRGMSAVTQHLAGRVDVQYRSRVVELSGGPGSWSLELESGPEGPFDVVILAMPSGQAADLLGPSPELARVAAGVAFNPCFALMLSLPRPLDVPYGGARIEGFPLVWIGSSSKLAGVPGRSGEDWVLHAGPDWTTEHLDDDPDQVTRAMVDAFTDAVRIDVPSPHGATLHRWRYAEPESIDVGCLVDADAGLAACGDWCVAPTVEGAFLSGAAAAGRILAWARSRAASPARQSTLFEP